MPRPAVWEFPRSSRRISCLRSIAKPRSASVIGQDVARPAALPAVSRIARTQTYPARPVHLIVGYPAGGPQDIVARLMGQWLSERLGQPFVIANRLGAGGNVGTKL